MVWFSKKKCTDDAATSGPSSDRALALQDPRTRVHTTSASSITTNTSVQNSTIIDNNTVTFRSTTQTVTHSQHARVTEIINRHTPSQSELEELMAQLKTNGGRATSSATTTTTGTSRRISQNSLNGVALRSTTSFKPNAEARRSSTLVKMEQTSVSQKQGRTVTQHVQTQRVVLSPDKKASWPPKPTTTNTSNASSSGSSSSSYKPYVSSFALKPVDAIYVSPYANKTNTVTSSVLSKPTTSSSVLSKPTTSSSVLSKPTTSSSVLSKPTTSSSVLSKPTTSSSVLSKPTYTSSVLSKPKTTATTSSLFSKPTGIGAKPTLSTRTTTAGKPFVSLNPSKISTTSIPASTTSDAIGEMPIKKPSSKKKLKAAEVVIFNNERFDTDNEFRSGSLEDVKALEKTFNALKCKVKTITNPKLSEIRDTVRKLEYKNFEDRSALVLVILSHGRRHDSVAAKDADYNLDDEVVFPILRNRTLADKPKILFVQACKGSRETGKFKTDAIKPHGNPSEILKCYSTYEGYVSYRLETGTPFIQILCDTLIVKPNVDIEAIMKEVMNLVKVYTKGDQVPSMTSTMTSKYVFGDYA